MNSYPPARLLLEHPNESGMMKGVLKSIYSDSNISKNHKNDHISSTRLQKHGDWLIGIMENKVDSIAMGYNKHKEENECSYDESWKFETEHPPQKINLKNFNHKRMKPSHDYLSLQQEETQVNTMLSAAIDSQNNNNIENTLFKPVNMKRYSAQSNSCSKMNYLSPIGQNMPFERIKTLQVEENPTHANMGRKHCDDVILPSKSENSEIQPPTKTYQ